MMMALSVRECRKDLSAQERMRGRKKAASFPDPTTSRWHMGPMAGRVTDFTFSFDGGYFSYFPKIRGLARALMELGQT